MHVSVGSKPEVTSVINVSAEGKVNLGSFEIHFLVVGHVHDACSVANHVLEVQGHVVFVRLSVRRDVCVDDELVLDGVRVSTLRDERHHDGKVSIAEDLQLFKVVTSVVSGEVMVRRSRHDPRSSSVTTTTD